MSYPFRFQDILTRLDYEMAWKKNMETISLSLCHTNGYIITWKLHQIFMFSNKVILAAVYNYDTPNSHPLPNSLLSYWRNWPIYEFHVSNMNWRQISPWQYIYIHFFNKVFDVVQLPSCFILILIFWPWIICSLHTHYTFTLQCMENNFF